jgi:hypothetical protein
MPAPPRPPYEIAHISDIPATAIGDTSGFGIEGEWKQLRHFFGIQEFSANAMVATDDPTKPGDEELYIVVTGRFRVRLDDEQVEVGPGTLVFVGVPSTVRSFTALEHASTVIAVGTNPGVRFVVSEFERRLSPPPRWS